MNRIRNTFDLAKASWNVLQADKELLLLPVISGIVSLAVMASFAVPFFLTNLDGQDLESPGTVAYLVMFVIYALLAFITIFFNAAVIHAANERLDGGDPTLRSSLAGAWSRVGLILPWALVSATVSVILQAIEERAGFVGRLVVSLIGIAWSLVTFLVLPILVIEGIGVRDALGRSAEMFKRTWGENVAAQVGFGLLGMVAGLLVVPVIALGAAAGGALLAVAIVASIAWIILIAVVLSALGGIFQTALYRYAAGDNIGSFFDSATLSGAFRRR